MKIRRRASLLSPVIKALVLAGKQRDPRAGVRAQPGSHAPKMRFSRDADGRLVTAPELLNHAGHPTGGPDEPSEDRSTVSVTRGKDTVEVRRTRLGRFLAPLRAKDDRVPYASDVGNGLVLP